MNTSTAVADELMKIGRELNVPGIRITQTNASLQDDKGKLDEDRYLFRVDGTTDDLAAVDTEAAGLKLQQSMEQEGFAPVTGVWNTSVFRENAVSYVNLNTSKGLITLSFFVSQIVSQL